MSSRESHSNGLATQTVIGLATTNNSASSKGATSENNRTQIFTLTLAAAETLQFSVAGNLFQLLAAPGPVLIRYSETAGFSAYTPGIKIVVAKTPFKTLEFSNPLSIGITITVAAGFDDISACIRPNFLVTPIEGFVAMTGGLKALSAQPIYFRRGFFYGYTSAPNGVAPTNNAGNVNLGKTRNLSDLVTPGQWIEYDAPDGQLFNLASLNALGNAGDGLFYSLT